MPYDIKRAPGYPKAPRDAAGERRAQPKTDTKNRTIKQNIPMEQAHALHGLNSPSNPKKDY